MKAAKIVNGAILGMDYKTVTVNGKVYVIYPPTIKKLAGAGYYLSNINDGVTLKDVISSLGDMEMAAHALSWLTQGDDSLFDEFINGTFEEIVDALETAYSLISTQSFLKLSGLAKNVVNLTAKQKL
jgi:hypothetical protein|nr:MAG TPA: hypothetical protein [Caudoviricetes sp.]